MAGFSEILGHGQIIEHLQNAMDQLKDDGMVVKYTQKEK